MEYAGIWSRIENGDRTSTLEAWSILKSMLEEGRDSRIDPEERIQQAAITVVSALDRLDQRETDRETLLFELRSDRGRCRELDDVLLRMLDPDAPEGISTYNQAMEAVDAIESAVRAADQPRPVEQVSAPVIPTGESDPEARNRRWAKLGCAVLLLIPVLLLAYKIVREEQQRRSPSADEVIAGSTLTYLDPVEEDGQYRMAASWATREIAASSYYSRRDGLTGILGWPDIYREEILSDTDFWAPRGEDNGVEWIEVGWNVDVLTHAIVIVESGNGGAIVAVDELAELDQNKLGAGKRVRLWSGTMEPEPGVRFVLIRLPGERAIRGLRIVMDTTQVDGVNGIDAVGLLNE